MGHDALWIALAKSLKKSNPPLVVPQALEELEEGEGKHLIGKVQLHAPLQVLLSLSQQRGSQAPRLNRLRLLAPKGIGEHPKVTVEQRILRKREQGNATCKKKKKGNKDSVSEKGPERNQRKGMKGNEREMKEKDLTLQEYQWLPQDALSSPDRKKAQE